VLESREENPSRNQREQPKLSTPISSTSTKKKTSSSAPLLLPHLTVRDVSRLDWRALAAAGFRAAVFDKDNTLTAPYSLELTAEATAALADAAEAFGEATAGERGGGGGGGNRSSLALLSNSAGLRQFDPEGREADALEAALGVAVIRHSSKKPAGDAAAIVRHFSVGAGPASPPSPSSSSSPSLAVSPSEIVMVGDRYLTDVAFGNRLGMLTVRVDPVEKTGRGEPRAVRASRAVEEALVRRRERRGMRAPEQQLVERARRRGAGDGGPARSREEMLEGFVRR
jgi:phosphatidylglycerophosphatase GEP4